MLPLATLTAAAQEPVPDRRIGGAFIAGGFTLAADGALLGRFASWYGEDCAGDGPASFILSTIGAGLVGVGLSSFGLGFGITAHDTNRMHDARWWYGDAQLAERLTTANMVLTLHVALQPTGPALVAAF